METCKTCRWWGGDKSWPVNRSFSETFKPCMSPMLTEGYGSDDDLRAIGFPLPLNGARVESDEGWSIAPGPDFGCINHEAKEPG